MAQIDIAAVFKGLKVVLKQASEYANAGYSDTSSDAQGSNKIAAFYNKTSEQPSGATQTQPKEITRKNIPENMMTTIDTEFRKVIEFIESYLLSDSKSEFFGLVLISMDFGIDYSQKGVIDTDISCDPIKIKYNPFYIQDLSLNQIIGATYNEIVKLVYMHPETFRDINSNCDQKVHENLEIASSVSSTDMVLNDIRTVGKNNRIALPDDTYQRSDLETETDRSINSKDSVEYYYSVAKNFRKQKPSSSSSNGPSDSNGVSIKSNKNSISTPTNGQGNPVHQWENVSDMDEAKERIKDVVKKAYDNSSSRGDIPGSLAQQIEALFKPPVLNWRDILKQYIGTIPSGHRPTRTRLNRRQPTRFDLSGTLSDKLVKIVIGIDTSGSVDDVALSYIFDEIFDITKNYKTEITVIECDCVVGKVYQIKNKQKPDTDVSGRGGTSFTPVIEYINKDKYFRDAVLIYFTDGYGESSIPRPLDYRNLWVVLDDEKNLSLSEPYGKVKALKADEKYKKMRGYK